MSEMIADPTGAAAPDTRMRAPPRVRRGLWAVLGVCAGVAALPLSLVAHRVPYFPIDVEITRWVQAIEAPALSMPMHALNVLGFPPLVLFIYSGIIVALFLSGRRWEAAAGTFGVLGSAGLNDLVKILVDRPRPDAQLVHVEHAIGNGAFPAGHVLNFSVLIGFLCCVVHLRMIPSWRRTSLIAFMLALIALMGVARIDAGEHWPSDVLGGYLLGTLWLSVTVLFYEWGRRRFPSLRAKALTSGGRRGFFIALVILSPLALIRPAHSEPVDADSLGASSGVPWNPPHPMARRLGWEQAMLLPGRLVSLPLAGLGYVTDNLLLRLEQSPRFANGLTPPRGAAGRAVVLKIPKMGDRTGLGGAVEVGKNVLHGTLESRLSAELAATLHRYNRTLLNWSGRPLSLQYGYEWRPQDLFYGVGNETPEDSVSNYATQGEFVRGGLVWESNRQRDRARPHSALGLWVGPRSQVTRTGRESGQVSYETRFPALGASTLDRRVENLVYGVSLLNDRRTGSPHWSRGWRTLLSVERFDAPIQALALHSATGDAARFTRYQAEAEAGISFMRDPRTVRLLVRMADQQVDFGQDRLLVSDLSMLGGHAGLGGYSPGRFHDLDLLLTRLAYVFPLERRLDMDLHSEWGAVYPDLWSGAKLSTLHNSFGFALRMRDDLAPRGSIGFDFSREAVRFRFSLGGVE